MKNKLFLLILFVGILVFSNFARAEFNVNWVKIDGDEIEPNGDVILDLERNKEIEVKIDIEDPTENRSDVEVTAFVSGYEYSDKISDTSDTFDMKAGVSYRKTLILNLPEKMDKDQYKLRVIVSDRDTDLASYSYELLVSSARHSLTIRDVIISPEGSVEAGRALLVQVRIKNVGLKDEESVKVFVSIPDLKVSATQYMDQIDADDSETSDELYLRIPECAKPGVYDVYVEVETDAKIVKTSRELTIDKGATCGSSTSTGNVVNPPISQEKTIITAPGMQDVEVGKSGGVYPILVTNSGSNAKTYTFHVSGVEGWADIRFDPSNVVVVGAGQTQTVYVYLAANVNSQPGQKAFIVSVDADGSSKDLALKANVIAGKSSGSSGSSSNGSWDAMKKIFEIGLVILVVILVILGLIIGFKKLKGNDDDVEPGQTYY